jgi:hypothetical protein
LAICGSFRISDEIIVELGVTPKNTRYAVHLLYQCLCGNIYIFFRGIARNWLKCVVNGLLQLVNLLLLFLFSSRVAVFGYGAAFSWLGMGSMQPTATSYPVGLSSVGAGSSSGQKRKADAGPTSRTPARVYYHSITGQPVLPHEDELDSDDDDTATAWITEECASIIDSFSDVPPPVKAFFKLWNDYVSRHKLYAELLVAPACEQFVLLYICQLRAWAPSANLLSSAQAAASVGGGVGGGGYHLGVPSLHAGSAAVPSRARSTSAVPPRVSPSPAPPSSTATAAVASSTNEGVGLREPLLCHLMNLQDHGLVDIATIEKCMRLYDGEAADVSTSPSTAKGASDYAYG